LLTNVLIVQHDTVHPDFELANRSKTCIFPTTCLPNAAFNILEVSVALSPSFKQNVIQTHGDQLPVRTFQKRKNLFQLPEIETWTVQTVA